jgi:uncharacterized protein YoxC
MDFQRIAGLVASALVVLVMSMVVFMAAFSCSASKSADTLTAQVAELKKQVSDLHAQNSSEFQKFDEKLKRIDALADRVGELSKRTEAVRDFVVPARTRVEGVWAIYVQQEMKGSLALTGDSKKDAQLKLKEKILLEKEALDLAAKHFLLHEVVALRSTEGGRPGLLKGERLARVVASDKYLEEPNENLPTRTLKYPKYIRDAVTAHKLGPEITDQTAMALGTRFTLHEPHFAKDSTIGYSVLGDTVFLYELKEAMLPDLQLALTIETPDGSPAVSMSGVDSTGKLTVKAHRMTFQTP